MKELVKFLMIVIATLDYKLEWIEDIISELFETWNLPPHEQKKITQLIQLKKQWHEELRRLQNYNRDYAINSNKAKALEEEIVLLTQYKDSTGRLVKVLPVASKTIPSLLNICIDNIKTLRKKLDSEDKEKLKLFDAKSGVSE